MENSLSLAIVSDAYGTLALGVDYQSPSQNHKNMFGKRVMVHIYARRITYQQVVDNYTLAGLCIKIAT